MNAGSLALARYRQTSGLRQSVIAERLGVTQGKVSEWERGQVLPRGPQRERIRDVVGIPVGAWDEESSGGLPDGYVEAKKGFRRRVNITACRGGEVRTCRVDMARVPSGEALKRFVEALFGL